MLHFMQAGGFAMWLILATAVATAVVAFVRPRAARNDVLLLGCILVLIEGMLGMSTGMEMVSMSAGSFTDQGVAVAAGLGELAHNGTFAATLAALLAVASVIAKRAAA